MLSIPGIGDQSRVSASPPGIPELSTCSTRTCTSCDMCTVQCSTAGWPIEARAWLFSRMKKHFRVIFSDFGRIPCNFRLDVRDFGKKCEIKGNKEKSRESGGSGQGKQPWGVGRYVSGRGKTSGRARRARGQRWGVRTPPGSATASRNASPGIYVAP